MGKGTTFSVSFPIPETITRDERRKLPKLIEGKGQKVLVVDDDISVLEPMKELISGLGYDAFIITSGLEAIKKYSELGPDAVLLDRNMPGMDGLTTARKILSIDPKANIVLVSGYDEDGPDGIDDEIKRSIKGYVTKPFDIEEVSQVLARLFQP